VDVRDVAAAHIAAAAATLYESNTNKNENDTTLG
jgi:hypothetical protein